MPVLGVESVVFGVDDVATCAAFYEAFGLTLERRDADGADFGLPEGSHVRVRHKTDPRLPAPYGEASGVREVIWGVDSEHSLEALVRDLRRDREVARDPDGTAHFRDDQGLPLGLRLFRRIAPEPVADPTNSPGRIARWNETRRWYDRAAPKAINHVVFGVPDLERGMRFYCERLGFRITDVTRDRGIFARCDGRHEHHNFFLLRSDALRFNHISFAVDNIDELMTGADHMQRRGWTSAVGLGRHRISSMIFYYIQSPCGGECEYSADGDYLDDNWQPRLWEPQYGNFHWVAALPPFLAEAPRPDMRILDGPVTVEAVQYRR